MHTFQIQSIIYCTELPNTCLHIMMLRPETFGITLVHFLCKEITITQEYSHSMSRFLFSTILSFRCKNFSLPLDLFKEHRT